MAISVANAWKNPSTAQSSAVTVAPSAGNALVVFVGGWNVAAASISVSDNIGGTSGWALAAGSNIASAAVGAFFYKTNIPAGITTVTVNLGAGGTYCSPIIHEVVGANVFTAGEAASGTQTGTTNPQTSQITNGTANSIYFAGFTNDEPANPGTAGINGTGTDGTWNLFSTTNSRELNGVSFAIEAVPNIIVSTSAPRRHGWTTGNFNAVWAIMVLHGSATTYSLTAAPGSIGEAGNGAGLLAGRRLSSAVGSLGETGKPAGLLAARRVTSAAGSFAEGGVAAALKLSRILSAAVAAFTESGVAASLKLNRRLTASAGAFVETGNSATLTYVGASTYTLIAAKGSFSFSGLSSSLLFKRRVTSTVGTFNEAGQIVNLLFNRKGVSSAGAYSETGNASGLLYGRRTVATPGTFTAAGIAAGLRYNTPQRSRINSGTLKRIQAYSGNIRQSSVFAGSVKRKNFYSGIITRT